MSEEYKCVVPPSALLLAVLSKKPASKTELKKLARKYAKEGIVCWDINAIDELVSIWLEKGLIKKGKGGKLELSKDKIESNQPMKFLVEQSVSLLEEVDNYLAEKEKMEEVERSSLKSEDQELDPEKLRRAIETISFILYSKGELTKDEYMQLVERFGPEIVSTVISWLRLIRAITRGVSSYRVVKENAWILERLSARIVEELEDAD